MFDQNFKNKIEFFSYKFVPSKEREREREIGERVRGKVFFVNKK